MAVHLHRDRAHDKVSPERRGVEERRRSVRRRVDDQVATLRSAHSVRVADISTSGVLFLSSRRVEPGTKGRLRFNMGATPFVADVRVTRVAASPESRAPYRIGATFIAINQEQHELIARFTRYE